MLCTYDYQGLTSSPFRNAHHCVSMDQQSARPEAASEAAAFGLGPRLRRHFDRVVAGGGVVAATAPLIPSLWVVVVVVVEGQCEDNIERSGFMKHFSIFVETTTGFSSSRVQYIMESCILVRVKMFSKHT